MENERLTSKEVEIIAKYSTGWKWKRDKDCSYKGEYFCQFEGLELKVEYIPPREPTGNIYRGDSGNPYCYIHLEINTGEDNIGSSSYTDDPKSDDFKNKYLANLLDRARNESSTERSERISNAIKKVRDLVSLTHENEGLNI